MGEICQDLIMADHKKNYQYLETQDAPRPDFYTKLILKRNFLSNVSAVLSESSSKIIYLRLIETHYQVLTKTPYFDPKMSRLDNG